MSGKSELGAGNTGELTAHGMVLPETSHSINWEQPEAFNRHVLEFIRRH